MKIYIAGPMRGYANFNFPAFDAAAELGRALGHFVTNPADMDRDLGFQGEGKRGTDEELRELDLIAAVERDIAAIIGCDAIALLPGWEKSTGATAEVAVAKWLGRTILDATTFKPFKKVSCHMPEVHGLKVGKALTFPTDPPVQQGELPNGDFVLKDSGNRTVFATGAQRDFQVGKGYFHLIPYLPIERLAKLYEAGARKYGANNWRKGIPVFAYLNSAIRHWFKVVEGLTDEDHAAAVMWNIAGYIWTVNEINEGRLSKGLFELTDKLAEEFMTKEKAA